MLNTYNTIQSLILSFEDNFHLPLLASVNAAHITGTPASLVNACQQAEQAVNALVILNSSCERLLKREGNTLTTEQVWEVANDLEEYLSSVQYISAELAQLGIDIAEEYTLK